MKYIVFSTLYLLILYSVSEFIFEPAYLYYELPWLDVPMHFLGGFGTASLIIAVTLYCKKTIRLPYLALGYLLVAIIWEVYEYTLDIAALRPWVGLEDTLSDVIIGFIGVVLAFSLTRK